MSQTINLGSVTAYASAVDGGYTGTYADFCAEMAEEKISLSDFKSVVAASSDFSDFKSKVAAL